MAARPVWRGQLRLALVSCPVALLPAHRSGAGLRFHLINPETGHRVRQVTVDADTDEELARADLVRGYEVEKGRHVVLTDEDFEEARVETSSLLAVDKFVPAEAIDPVFHDASYFVAPDGDTGADVYPVLRDAIAQAGRVALSRIVIGRRERTVAIHPMGRGLVLHTLFDPAEMASADEASAQVPEAAPARDMVDLARQLIDRRTAAFEPADLADRYEARLRAIIEARREGEDPPPPARPAEDGGNVVDLMAALRRSLGQEERRPAARARTGSGATPPSAAGKGSAGKEAGAKGAGAKAKGGRSAGEAPPPAEGGRRPKPTGARAGRSRIGGSRRRG